VVSVACDDTDTTVPAVASTDEIVVSSPTTGAPDRSSVTDSTVSSTPDAGTTQTASGVRIPVPDGWSATGYVLSTEFGGRAACTSSSIVDQPSAPTTSGSPSELRSFVQACTVPITDGLDIDEFIAARPGGSDDFVPTTVGECVALRQDGPDQISIYLQTTTERIEVIASVVTNPEQRSQRLAELHTVLTGMTCRP
jgi:hypothetical protein